MSRLGKMVTGLALAALTFLCISSCSWESGGGNDAGNFDGDNGEYPPPPYGVNYNETAQNFRVEQTLCIEGGARGAAIYASDFLDAKATLVSVHAGWCGPCKTQAATMEDNLYQEYKDQGLRILLILFEDDERNSEHQALLDYTCTYRDRYGMTFTLAIDPGANVMGQFFRPTEAGTPLNMLLDDEMVIRYKVEGTIPNVLEGNIEALLSE